MTSRGAQSAQVSVELDDGRRARIREAHETDGITNLGGIGTPVVHGSPLSETGSEVALVAVAPPEEIVGAAWLVVNGDEQPTGVPRVAVEANYRQVGVEAALAKAIADLARRRGCSQLVAYVPFLSSDVLSSFRAGGLGIVSCLTFEGTAEVVLALE